VIRPQSPRDVDAALARIRELGFPTTNVDLIYGMDGQTSASWIASIDAALRHEPQELYLYPLYVRPLTGLGKTGRSWDDQRLALYRAGRDHLLALGWTQVSMRMFRAPHARNIDGPVYCCQEDGMVGIGSGARSYAERVHYSTEYAVAQGGVRKILRDYIAREDFAHADWGIRLDEDDRRRRWAILSLLADGIDATAYRARFGGDVTSDLPLSELVDCGMAAWHGDLLALTPAGRERSDAIGPWLVSARVRERMEAWELR
jgi:oxygen-independent coproporphyrinogen-3 oxidase